MRYGLWTLLESEGRVADRHLCRCDCGTVTWIQLCNMRSGRSTNCGCVKSVRTRGKMLINHLGEDRYMSEWCDIAGLMYATVAKRLRKGLSIEDALKPIKGTRMSKLKCTGCKERFDRDSMIKLPAGNFHSIDCATGYAQAAARRSVEKRMRKAEQVGRVERKATKKAVKDLNRKDIRWQHKQTQPVFNRMRVLQELRFFHRIGREPTCVSCQKPLGGDQWCCGHFKTAGGNGRLRYDNNNTFLQHNYYCNMAKSGDIESYKHGLITGPRFTEEKGREIIAYCEANTGPYKWGWEELEEMRKCFAATVRELESEMSLL